mgnify:CR=1 FL=1
MPPVPSADTVFDIDDISGAFALEVTARFDEIQGAYWQRILDFGSGPQNGNIILAQVENTSDMMFALYQDGVVHRVIAPDAIVAGEVATWRIGRDPDGRMWIEKDGVLEDEIQAVVPANVPRINEYIGQSNWADDDDLIGAVMGIDVVQPGDDGLAPADNDDGALAGSFRIDLAARVDDVSGRADQGLVAYGSADGSASLVLAQDGASDGLALQLTVGEASYTVTAPGALVAGEPTSLSAGLDTDGTLWLAQDGVRLGEVTLSFVKRTP